MNIERIIRILISPANSGPILALIILFYYGIFSQFDDNIGTDQEQFMMLLLSVVSAIGIIVGWGLTPTRDLTSNIPRHHVNIIGCVAITFSIFFVIVIVTAPNIPILIAISGANAHDIAVSRENFLKARVGIAQVLPYVNAILAFSFLPYAMCLAFFARMRIAYFILAAFFFYSMLSLEKAFFLRALCPLLAFLIVSHNRNIRISLILLFAVFILIVNIILSGFANEMNDVMSYLVRRIIYVPIDTAAATLRFWRIEFNSELLLGATNLLFSTIFMQQRVNLEQLVFVYQEGPFETNTASANSVFFVDAYVNFGWTGVLVTSIILGSVLKLVGRSADVALVCLTPLLLYSVFLGSFYSVMFSNGFIMVMLVSRYCNSVGQKQIFFGGKMK